MKPVTQWTPEEAKQAASYAASNPDDAEVRDMVSQYDSMTKARASIARPPEFIPKQGPGLGGFMNLLPSYIGGGTEHFQEPSKEQFLRLFNGKPPEGFDVDQGYKDYADALWAQQYDKAKAEGKPVVRHQKMMEAVDTENPMRQALKPVIKFGGDVADAAVGDIGSLLHTGSAGMDEPVVAYLGGKDSLDAYRSARERTPLKHDLELLGAFAPDALAGRMAGKILGAANRSGGPVASALKGIGAGGVVGGLSRGLSNFGAGLADAIVASDTPTANGDTERELAMQRALNGTPEGIGSGMLIGGGLGALGGALGGLSRTLRSGANGSDLRNLEAAGGETSVLQGVKLPKDVEANFTEAEATRSNPVDVAAANVRGPFAEAAANRNKQLIADIIAKKEQYLNSKEGKTPVQPMPLIRALMDEVKGSKFVKGDAIKPAEATAETAPAPEVKAEPVGQATGAASPVAKGIPGAKADVVPEMPTAKGKPRKTETELRSLPFSDTREFADALNASVKAKVVPTEGAGGGAQYGDGAFALSAEQAANRGIKLDIPAHLQGRPLDTLSVIIQPRQMTARDVDRIQALIDKAAKVSSKRGGGDEAYVRLTRAIRQVRDQFPANEHAPEELTATLDDGTTVKGWSALNALESRQISDLKKTLENAGIRNPPKEFGAGDVTKQLGDSIRKYKYGEGRYDADLALEDIARGVPGGMRKLATVTATRVAPKLQEKSAILPNLPILGQGLNLGPLLGAAHFRADPLARALRPLIPGATVAATAGSDVGTDEYRKLLELAQRLQQEQRP